MANRLGLTRDQLATFLKDPEQIKQFERLFTTVDQTVTIILPAIDTDAGVGESQAQEAFGIISTLSQAVGAQIAGLQSNVDGLVAQLKELAANVQGIESNQLGLDSLTAQLASVIAALQSIESQQSELQSVAAQLADIVDTLEALEARQNDYDTHIAQLFDVSADLQILKTKLESGANAADQLVELAAKLQSIELRQDDTLSGRIERLQDDVDGLFALAVVHSAPKRRRIGNFYDTTTQTAAAINTAYAITFNTTDVSDGVYLGSPTSRVYVDTEATYNFQFSAQLDNTSGGNHLTFIWYRINGADVANSASQVRLKGTDGELVAAWNFVTKLKAGDYFELMWSVSDTAVQLVAQSAAAPVPGIPSAILSVVTAD